MQLHQSSARLSKTKIKYILQSLLYNNNVFLLWFILLVHKNRDQFSNIQNTVSLTLISWIIIFKLYLYIRVYIVCILQKSVYQFY